ncbi:hypothetical protein [Bacillus toyonensis]|uniref:hypothetical protein n=1 Tax=Bacillus toyonensis TaxID=155322 RepID=UPI00159BBCD0|nr:hypothetical protein [Bacillus toyonensis]
MNSEVGKVDLQTELHDEGIRFFEGVVNGLKMVSHFYLLIIGLIRWIYLSM